MNEQGKSLYTARQVREGERALAERLGMDMYELMENAGKAVFEALERFYPHCQNLSIFCGGGNNGGDGYVVARLAKEAGYNVTLYQVGDRTKLTGDAKTACENWLSSGGKVMSADRPVAEDSDLIIDALLGTGLSGSVRKEYEQAIRSINDSQAAVIAVDIPSGLCADTGVTLGETVNADYTVSFIGLKRGLYTGKAVDHTGEVLFAGLGVSAEFEESNACESSLLSRANIDSLLPGRRRSAHKGDNGKVLCLGGDRGMFGAIRLAAEACARVGAGLTRVVTQPENVPAIVSACPELMVFDWRGNSNEINEHLEWADVIALGPGLGTSSWGRSLVGYSRTVEKPVVLDADGLNILTRTPDFNSKRIITPHPGEAARLLGTSVTEVEKDRFHSAKLLQRKFGGVVVLKGAGTLVYDGKKYWVCQAGNPGMATGGMGDLLTGTIAGLLAQGLSLSEAARAGVWLHSSAADISAEREGERGLLASDLLPHIRRLANRL